MKTTSTTYPKKDNIKKQYYLCDADGQVLGRMASRIAIMLRGKNKPIYHPAVDTGDYVIVINADKVKLTGNKLDQKIHYTHSNYPGGLREYKYKDLMQNKSDFVIRKAVRGMLPKNSLGRLMIRKLKVYSGPEHPHQAQQPIKIELC